MVGTAGLEPATSRPPGERATRLRYAPIDLSVLQDLQKESKR